jgi:5-methylcytosine-specific restriction endonuclease McrA
MRRGLEKLSSKDRRRRAEAVIKLHGWTCWLCNKSIDKRLTHPHPMSLSMDHYVPVWKGGSNRISNLRPAHWICNHRRGKGE